MTRRVLLTAAFVLGCCQVTLGQYYAPQQGAGAPPARAAQPQQPPQGQQAQPASAYGPQQPGGQQPAAQQARAPQYAQPQQPQQPSNYAVRPAGGQQPVGQQPLVQQPVGQPVAPAGQINARPPGIPAAQIPPSPQPPAWAMNINAAEQKWLDDVLGFWETRSNKVQTFECKFQCWEYNAFAPPDIAQKFSKGVIKYAQPDRGLFRMEELSVYEPPTPGAAPPDKPKYIAQDKTLGEHWICDGQQIFQFDAVSRKVRVTPIPPQMQGQAIADGPLPFMFGAKAQTIKARYWVRGLQGPPGKYRLQAVPKSRSDAQNFKMVEIQLDQADYLPEMLQVFDSNNTDRTNYRKSYLFTERKTTDDKASPLDAINILKLFEREFYEPKIPTGWKRELQADVVNLMNPPPGAAQRPPQEATRPAAPQKTLSPLPR